MDGVARGGGKFPNPDPLAIELLRSNSKKAVFKQKPKVFTLFLKFRIGKYSLEQFSNLFWLTLGFCYSLFEVLWSSSIASGSRLGSLPPSYAIHVLKLFFLALPYTCRCPNQKFRRTQSFHFHLFRSYAFQEKRKKESGSTTVVSSRSSSWKKIRIGTVIKLSSRNNEGVRPFVPVSLKEFNNGGPGRAKS